MSPIRPFAIALSAAALLAGTTPPPAPRFCERLAPRLSMKWQPAKSGRTATWRFNNLGGLGPALFGGTSVIGISVRPVELDNRAEAERIDRACDPTAKGALCRIEGPARVTINAGKIEAQEIALLGERTELEIRKTVLTCQDQ